MNNQKLCKIILNIFPDEKLLELNVSTKLFRQAYSLLKELSMIALRNCNISLELRKLLFVNNNKSIIIIDGHKIIKKDNYIIEVFKDPEYRVQSFILGRIGKQQYDVLKRYLEIFNINAQNSRNFKVFKDAW